jgi:hypothetical protein
VDAEAIESALRAGDVGALVGRAEQASGLAARRYAIEVVARALMLADPGSVGPDLRQRARALGLEQEAQLASEVVAPPHGVRVPLVDRGRGTAFVRMLWVEIDPTGIPVERPALGPEARAAVVEALRQAAEQVPPAQDGERVRLVAARPAAMEGVAIEGASLGAAALVSANSRVAAIASDSEVPCSRLRSMFPIADRNMRWSRAPESTRTASSTSREGIAAGPALLEAAAAVATAAAAVS